jgi:hypothetical protein
MATKMKKKPAIKKVGFQRLSRARRAEVSAMGGKATAKMRRKLKKG